MKMGLLRNKFRRKKEGKTDYKLRLRLIKSKMSRFVVRKTNKNIIAQIAGYSKSGDNILVGVDSNSVRKLGWVHNKRNIPCAYLVGYLCGSKAVKKNIKAAIVDVGMNSAKKKGKLFSAVRGAIDAGLTIECSKDALPDDKRLFGEHLKSKGIRDSINK